jgi:hypothetical protein
VLAAWEALALVVELPQPAITSAAATGARASSLYLCMIVVL